MESIEHRPRLAPRTGNANASRIPNRESRDRETARVTYVIQIPHRPPPGRERPCSDHNRPNPFTIGSARPDSHTLPRRSPRGLGRGFDAPPESVHASTATPQVLAKPAGTLRSDRRRRSLVQFSRAGLMTLSVSCADSVLCSSNAARNQTAPWSACAEPHCGKPRAEKQKVTRPDADPVVTPSLPRRVLPVASLLPVTRPRESSDGDAERGGVLPQSTRRASASPAEI